VGSGRISQMLPVTSLKNGTIFQESGQPLLVVKYEHKKLGRGKANIKIKARNLKTGALLERTFISGAKVEEAMVEKKNLQFLYFEGENAIFMDPVSFEQAEVAKEVFDGREKFMQEGEKVEVLFFEGEPVSVELPLSLILKVTETGPGVKGNSATNIFKPATLENGLQTKVPLFIKVGEKIKVDTKNGEYVERAKA